MEGIFAVFLHSVVGMMLEDGRTGNGPWSARKCAGSQIISLVWPRIGQNILGRCAKVLYKVSGMVALGRIGPSREGEC